MSRPSAAVYCVTGRDFFPGALAMVNSLRLQGHREPVFVLDCGMLPGQRELLSREATVVPAPRSAAPSLLKLVLPRAHPAEVTILLDADLIVTRPLTELIDAAASGAIVAFENDTHRHFPEWGPLLDLGTVRDGPYVTTSALFAGEGPARAVLPLVEDRQAEIDPERTWLGAGTDSDPLYYLDQDVLNAVVHSRLEPSALVALDARLAPIPPFAGVRIVDDGALRCAYRDGTEPYLLHHCFRKPWLERVRGNVYSRLLTRLLLGADVPLRLDPAELPTRLRTGVAASAGRTVNDLALAVPGVVRRLRRRPARVTAWPSPPPS
jgi:hypothetical protein